MDGGAARLGKGRGHSSTTISWEQAVCPELDMRRKDGSFEQHAARLQLNTFFAWGSWRKRKFNSRSSQSLAHLEETVHWNKGKKKKIGEYDLGI